MIPEERDYFYDPKRKKRSGSRTEIILLMTARKVVFKTKIICSGCNKVLMGETLIASGGKILCKECFENQHSKSK